MINDFLKVTEIEKFSTLTSKQIRNKVVSLKKTNQFNDLIFGGGRGKGGKYKVHYSLLPLITNRVRRRKQLDIQSTKKSRLLSEYYFSKTHWNYFGCVKPNIDTDINQLTNCLHQFDSFYVIHRKNEKNHIHFTIVSPLNNEVIKRSIKEYFTKLNISIDRIFLTDYQYNYGENTLQYLLRKGRHSLKNDLIDWGLVHYTI